MKKFIEELKRRNVIKSAVAYLVVAWILLQVFTVLLPIVDAPDWVLKGLTLLLAIGLPIWIVVSWVYDITPQGIEKTIKDSGSELVTQATNKRLNVFIIVSLSIAVIVMGLKISNVFTDSDKQYAIAVLYFNNMNNDETDEWFSDGFTLDIYTYLAAIKSLKVISPKSTLKYKDTDKTISEIAYELGVDYIVDGNVRKYNKQVLISASLFKANDEQVWEDRYDESEEDPFAIQHAVSKKIVQQLKVKLSPQEEKTLDKLPTENMEAYNLFSKGRLVNDSRKKEDLEKNIKLNKQAIALDPNFAEAYAEIGQSTFLFEAYYSGDTHDLWVKKANPYLEKAIQLNPNIAMIYGVKGMIFSNEGNWDKAKEYFEKAIALNPNSATIRFQYANHADSHGDYNRSIFQTAKAQELDPLSPLVGHLFFANLINNFKAEEAEQYYSKYAFLFTKPGEQFEKESILIAYKNKDWEAGLRFLETELKKDPDNAILNRKLGEAYDGILLDDDNYLKYTKKAYQLDSINIDNAFEYYFALLRGEKFAEAKTLIESKNFKSLLSKGAELNFLYEYYLAKKDYEKVEEVLKDSLMSYSIYNKLIYHASVGNRKKVDSLLKLIPWPEDRALVYAILKEKDSMYYYLERVVVLEGQRAPEKSPRTGFRLINNLKAFDPYRKEERFKEILRKHYLPITHWNE